MAKKLKVLTTVQVVVTAYVDGDRLTEADKRDIRSRVRSYLTWSVLDNTEDAVKKATWASKTSRRLSITVEPAPLQVEGK